MKILLLFGGRGAEHEVSVHSAAYVCERLLARGHTLFPLGVTRSGALLRARTENGTLTPAWYENAAPAEMRSAGTSLAVLSDGDTFIPDLVFSVMHGKDGEDGAWQGLFALTRTPFVGAGVCASAIGMNKRLSKLLAGAFGVPTVPYLTARRYDATLEARVAHKLSYPLFVKPVSGGSSVGASFVENEGGLKDAVLFALENDEEALIEEAVKGSELSVGVLERDGALLLSPPAEIRTDGFYDYDAKYNGKPKTLTLPAPITPWETAFVKQLAASVFRAIGARDMARVDFLRREDGKIYFNEINTLPGFTEDSLFPRLFASLGVDALTFLTEGRS